MSAEFRDFITRGLRDAGMHVRDLIEATDAQNPRKRPRSLRWLRTWLGTRGEDIPFSVALEVLTMAGYTHAFNRADLEARRLEYTSMAAGAEQRVRVRPVAVVFPGSAERIGRLLSAELAMTVAGLSMRFQPDIQRVVENFLQRYEGVFKTEMGRDFLASLEANKAHTPYEQLFSGYADEVRKAHIERDYHIATEQINKEAESMDLPDDERLEQLIARQQAAASEKETALRLIDVGERAPWPPPNIH